MNNENLKKLNQIKKSYKNTEMLLDIYLENYHNIYIYIRIDYYKKLKTYKLSWIDLANYDNNFDTTISYEYIPKNIIEYLKNIISKIDDSSISKENLKDEYKVSITSNLLTKNNTKLNIIFNRYIDKTNQTLLELLSVIFDNLPRKLNCFLEEMAASITGNTEKYEYTEEFNFDLYNDNLDTLFKKEIISRGKKYTEEGRVLFLEKINDRYFAVIAGQSLYVVIIKYQKETKKTQVYCSCPCEFFCKHIYSVISSIRDHKIKKFYKITPKNEHTSLLDRVMNFNFLLSIGIDDQGNNYIIVENGQIKLLPIKNKKGTSDWQVLEDDEKETLTNRLKNILNK